MIVICVEGCHGCGKTELSKQFQDAGFWVLDEAFLDMPEYALHPQSLLMETTWVCCWFERLLRRADECKRADVPHEQQVFIADRSPFSAVFYAQNGKGNLLEPIIREHVRELRESLTREPHCHGAGVRRVAEYHLGTDVQRQSGRSREGCRSGGGEEQKEELSY